VPTPFKSFITEMINLDFFPLKDGRISLSVFFFGCTSNKLLIQRNGDHSSLLLVSG
jgi:hypothetical protein